MHVHDAGYPGSDFTCSALLIFRIDETAQLHFAGKSINLYVSELIDRLLIQRVANVSTNIVIIQAAAFATLISSIGCAAGGQDKRKYSDACSTYDLFFPKLRVLSEGPLRKIPRFASRAFTHFYEKLWWSGAPKWSESVGGSMLT